MKFSKTLNPEIVLGLRGDKVLQNFYKAMHETIKILPEGFGVDYSDTGKAIHDLDQSTQSHLLLTYKFKQEIPKTYYIPKDFAQALSKVDPNIPTSIYPERFFGYIEFADNSVIDKTDNTAIAGAYVFIGKGKETAAIPEKHDDKFLWISVVFKAPEGKIPPVGTLAASLKDGQISKFLGDQKQLKKTYPINKEVFRTIINSTLYINSVDADLLNLPVLPKKISQTQKKKLAQNTLGISNECTIPVILVSWGYKKPRQYSVNETFVETHMRWQRCGLGLKQIKLIWVRPHTRIYENEK